MRIIEFLPKWLLLAMMSHFVFGCGPDVGTLHQEVMAVHDEVMPLMGELQSMRMKIEAGQAGRDSLNQQTCREAILRLHAAEDAMWDWMNQYRQPGDGTSDAAGYLRDQKALITAVAGQMQEAIRLAKPCLP